MWRAVTGNERWALLLVCVCYLAIVQITSRGLIAAPRYRLLLGRVRDGRARIAVLTAAAGGDPLRVAELAVLTSLLDGLEGRDVVWKLPRTTWVLAIPLSKLAAAWRTLHGVERRLLSLEGEEEVAARIRAVRLRLAESDLPADVRLGAELEAALPVRSAAAGSDARALLCAATEALDDREDAEAEREYEQQRAALWLATTGLGVVLLLGVVLGHELTMLLGALGGFLSPMLGVMRSQRPSSWGVLVLAPVGGALAAVGGLLLVRMLADPELNLLGRVFLENSWDAPARPLSLAVALLFGFSGTLFSRLALTATGQLVSGTGRGAPAGGPPVL